jgi:hypothetical protein
VSLSLQSREHLIFRHSCRQRSVGVFSRRFLADLLWACEKNFAAPSHFPYRRSRLIANYSNMTPSQHRHQMPFTPDAVSDAYSLIKQVLHKTPILTSTSINSLTTPQLSIYFKAELFQKTGVFKFRGASYAIACLPPTSLKNGVVTHSSGNHSAALACAAREKGVKCYVVMVSSPTWNDTNKGSLRMLVSSKLRLRKLMVLRLPLSSIQRIEPKYVIK